MLSDCLFCQNNNGANEEAYQKRGLRSIGDTSGECQEYYAVLDGNKRDVDLLGGNVGCYIHVNTVAGSAGASKGARIFRQLIISALHIISFLKPRNGTSKEFYQNSGLYARLVHHTKWREAHHFPRAHEPEIANRCV